MVRDRAVTNQLVSLLVTLAVVSGLIDVLGAVLLAVMSVSLSWSGGRGVFLGSEIVRVVFLIVSVISAVLFVCGVSSFVQAYGLREGRGWAWSWVHASSMVGLALSLIALGVGVVGVASNALTLCYLTRTEVKAYFGSYVVKPIRWITDSVNSR